MKILIASGIYPPDIGGPAQYARNLYEMWKGQGHDVKVAAYRWERAFPSFVRHILYFTKIIRKGWDADMILVLDTWSAAVPTMFACGLMHKKYILRTGGDFLWESYVERTGDMVLFKDFYPRTKNDTAQFLSKLSRKEKIIFSYGGKALRQAERIIFSTQWQKEIFERAYSLNPRKNCIVENFCGERLEQIQPENRTFVASTRVLKWKNMDMLKQAFEIAREEVKKKGLPDIDLDTSKAMYSNFVERMRHSYAVILTSIGDISPNMIFDAIMTGVPYIATKENGISNRINQSGLSVDPQHVRDIADKIVWLADPKNRAAQAEKVAANSFVHTWEQIGDEIINVWKSL